MQTPSWVPTTFTGLSPYLPSKVATTELGVPGPAATLPFRCTFCKSLIHGPPLPGTTESGLIVPSESLPLGFHALQKLK